MIKCGTKVASCVGKCRGDIASSSCISCLGGSYQRCKACIGMGVSLQQGTFNLTKSTLKLCRGFCVQFDFTACMYT